ncbi:hypothetical protein [Domibacillus robiginosus]|nr:hypothetical protein [Domibacillus robiginosus]
MKKILLSLFMIPLLLFSSIGAVMIVNITFIFFLYFVWKRGKRLEKQK